MRVSIESYESFQQSFVEQHSPSEALLSVPWLPEGMDLAHMVFGAESTSAQGTSAQGTSAQDTGKLNDVEESMDNL